MSSRQQLEQLGKDIEAQAAKLKVLKETHSRAALANEIFRLLELKYLHPEFRHLCYTPHSPMPPKVFKVRWRIKMADGKVIRMQRPFVDRTSITGAEIATAVSECTSKKYPNLGGFVKLEERVVVAAAVAGPAAAAGADAGEGPADAGDDDNGPARRFLRAIAPTDIFRLPVTMPGPRLADVHIVELVATFPELIETRCPRVYRHLDTLPPLVECGVNLFSARYDKDRRRVVNRAVHAGVVEQVCLSVNQASTKLHLGLCRARRRTLFTTVGLHPRDAAEKGYDEAYLVGLAALIAEDAADPDGRCIVAVGECGLDYSDHGLCAVPDEEAQVAQAVLERKRALKAAEKAQRDLEKAKTAPPPAAPPAAKSKREKRQRKGKPEASDAPSASSVTATSATTATQSDVKGKSEASGAAASASDAPAAPVAAAPKTVEEMKDAQRRWLRAQLDLAIRFNLPVVLHERDAHADVVAILRELRPKLVGVLVNCFTGTPEQLREYIALDCHIGISGIIANTDRGAHLAELMPTIPRGRFLLGTDAPYMLPFNMTRPYPKRNEPCYLPYILIKLAGILDGSTPDLARSMTENAHTFFRITPSLYNGSIVGVQKPTPRDDAAHEASDVEKAKGKYAAAPVDEEGIFVYEGVRYRVSKREDAILKSQRDLLAPESFAKLLRDFQLEVDE